jgi:peptidoglycan/xylan/chitin deacetylase (PgdA/CDA1 family)
MSWEELRGLADGGWEIGSHTCSHPRLTQIDDDALERELTVSREVCAERMGRPCESIAYPYGDHDDRVVEATGRAGYSAAGTLPARVETGGPLRYPRVGVYYGDSLLRFRAKVSPLVHGLRASPLGRAADGLRGALARR